MGRVTTYLVDRAIIRSTSVSKNKGVVTARNAGQVVYTDRGDWIPARLRPVSGDESQDGVVTDLPHTHELVLHLYDLSGDPVVLTQSDRFDVMMKLNGAYTDRLTNFKVVGVIQPIRKTHRMVSYVVPVVRSEEF